jgi:hypothetical protein
MFLRNVGEHLLDYTAWKLQIQQISPSKSSVGILCRVLPSKYIIRDILDDMVLRHRCNYTFIRPDHSLRLSVQH